MSFIRSTSPDLLRGVDRWPSRCRPRSRRTRFPRAGRRDVLACAMTGAARRGMPAPDPAAPHASLAASRARSSSRPRGARRADRRARPDLARFTRLSGAAVYGGVGMGPRRPRSAEARHHRRDAGPAPDHFSTRTRAFMGSRSSSHEADRCRQGFPRRPPRPQALTASARRVLLGHAAAPDRGPRPRDAAHAVATTWRAAGPPTSITTRSTRRVGAEVGMLLGSGRARCAERSRRHPHEAPRQPAADFLARHDFRSPHPRQPQQAQRTQRSPPSRTAGPRLSPPTCGRGIDITALSHVVNSTCRRSRGLFHAQGHGARRGRWRFRDLVSPDEEADLARSIARSASHRARDAAGSITPSARPNGSKCHGRADRRIRAKNSRARARTRQRSDGGPTTAPAGSAPGWNSRPAQSRSLLRAVPRPPT